MPKASTTSNLRYLIDFLLNLNKWFHDYRTYFLHFKRNFHVTDTLTQEYIGVSLPWDPSRTFPHPPFSITGFLFLQNLIIPSIYCLVPTHLHHQQAISIKHDFICFVCCCIPSPQNSFWYMVWIVSIFTEWLNKCPSYARKVIQMRVQSTHTNLYLLTTSAHLLLSFVKGKRCLSIFLSVFPNVSYSDISTISVSI